MFCRSRDPIVRFCCGSLVDDSYYDHWHWLSLSFIFAWFHCTICQLSTFKHWPVKVANSADVQACFLGEKTLPLLKMCSIIMKYSLWKVDRNVSTCRCSFGFVQFKDHWIFASVLNMQTLGSLWEAFFVLLCIFSMWEIATFHIKQMWALHRINRPGLVKQHGNSKRALQLKVILRNANKSNEKNALSKQKYWFIKKCVDICSACYWLGNPVSPDCMDSTVAVNLLTTQRKENLRMCFLPWASL